VSALGQSSVVLDPQQMTTVQPAAPAGAAQAIHFNLSNVRITTSGGVVPLLEMPDGVRVAGFVAPGIEVNQVFASVTSAVDDVHVIEVPGGELGPYNLILEGLRDDALFTADIDGLSDDNTIYSQ